MKLKLFVILLLILILIYAGYRYFKPSVKPSAIINKIETAKTDTEKQKVALQILKETLQKYYSENNTFPKTLSIYDLGELKNFLSEDERIEILSCFSEEKLYSYTSSQNWYIIKTKMRNKEKIIAINNQGFIWEEDIFDISKKPTKNIVKKYIKINPNEISTLYYGFFNEVWGEAKKLNAVTVKNKETVVDKKLYKKAFKNVIDKWKKDEDSIVKLFAEVMGKMSDRESLPNLEEIIEELERELNK